MKRSLLTLLMTLCLALFVTACASSATDEQAGNRLDGPALVLFYTDN